MNQKTRNIIIAASIILAILCVAFIFGNSLKDSTESSEQSFAVRDILSAIASFFGFEGEIEISELRNFAHVAEFFALGICLSTFALSFAQRKHKLTAPRIAASLLLSVSAGVAVAFIDEKLQTFSEGRAYDVEDIARDTLGIVLGTLLILIIYMIYRKVRSHSATKSE